MQMSSNTQTAFGGKWHEGFLFLGATPDTNAARYAVKIPYPTLGSATFATSRMVDAGRNANGEMVGRMVGRAMHKQTLAWERIPCEIWWGLHRWFEAGHFTFYCHFFNHNTGYFETRLFYLGDVKTNPVQINAATGAPAYYTNAAFNVIDCGVV